MTQTETLDQLDRLLGYLEHDPDNPNLLRDAAEAALAAHRPDEASNLLARLEAQIELDEGAQNLAGLVAMLTGDFKQAIAKFAPLLEAHPEETGVRFNLAWSLAMEGDHLAALSTLDETTIRALPQAAMLDVHLRHSSGEFDHAAERARDYMRQHPDDEGLAAAVSVLAMDVEDKALAREAAINGGAHPDALTTLGTLALGEQNIEEATPLLDRALAQNPNSPRALIGRGLVRILENEPAAAAIDLDRGAEEFGTHLGSWLAAGWAYLIAGDRDTAKARFKHSMNLDDTFAENHGALAVIAALGGDLEASQTFIKTAFRLDGACFSAAFAQMLIEMARGKNDVAQEIFDRALSTSLGSDGETINTALVRLSSGK